MKVTIQDVARASGVSVATVSKILNDKGQGYSEKTQVRVRETVEQLQYIPNHMARSMARKKSMRIGLVTTNLGNPFCTELLRGATRAVQNTGYSVLLFESTEDYRQQIRTIQECIEMQVDGLFIHMLAELSSQRELRAEVLQPILKNQIPLVLTERELIPNDNICKVLFDFEKGAHMAVQHLIELGHTRIGGIFTSFDNARFFGYLRALREAGIDTDFNRVIECVSPMVSGGEALRQLLERDPTLTGIFLAQDVLTMEAYRYCHRIGKQIGRELSIIGFDDIPSAELWNPPLTTIHQPGYQMGEQAADLLFQQIQGKPIERQIYVFEPKLVLRQSTARLQG